VPIRLSAIEEAEPPTFTEIAGLTDLTGALWAVHGPESA
jgi:hypothetical protein